MQRYSSFFKRLWLFIFVVIFMLGSVAIILFGHYQTKFNENKKREESSLILNVYSSKLDDEIQQIFDNIDFSVLENAIRNYAYGDVRQYNKIKISDYLSSSFVFANNLKFRVVLYKPEYDCFIDASGVEHLKDMEEKYGNIPFKKTEIEKIDQNIRISVSDKKMNCRWIVFLKNFKIDKNHDLCFLVALDKEALIDEIEQISLNGFIIREEGGLLFQYGENENNNVIWKDSEEVPNLQYGIIEGENSASIILLFMNVFFLIIWCIISIMIARYIVTKVYAPFRMFLEKHLSNEFSDEFIALESMVAELTNNNLLLKNKTEMYVGKLRTNFFRDVFCGRLNADEIARQKKELSITIDEDKFKVVMLVAQCSDEDKTEIDVSIFNVAKEISGELFEIEENKYILILKENVNLQDTEQILLKTIMLLEYKYNVKIRVVIYDKIFSSIAEIHDLYIPIMGIEKNSILSQRKLLLHSSLDEFKMKNKTSYSLELENKFVELIKAGEKKEAFYLLEGILSENINKQKLSSKDLVEFKFALVNTAKRVIDILNLTENSLTDGREIGEILFSCHSYEQLSEELTHIYNSVFEKVKSMNQNEQNLLFNSINDYVNENFMDNQKMSVVNLASYFNISVGYISKLYKRYSNETFIEHLIKIRVEESKKLLTQEPPMKIKDIGERVGYINTTSFIRVFKKITGVTPDVYRTQKK